MIKEEIEILRYAGCLDEVDDDVAELALTLVPKDKKLISIADLTYGIQKIKDKIRLEYQIVKCPLCKNDLTQVDGVSISFNGVCKTCARDIYIIWRDLHLEKDEKCNICGYYHNHHPNCKHYKG